MQNYNQIEDKIESNTIIQDPQFYEIVRRIAAPKLCEIEETLTAVTSFHINILLTAMDNQENLLNHDSFIHGRMFPFTALKAVRMKVISPLQFGTLMALWGSLDNIIPKKATSKQVKPEFVPLFTADGGRNPLAFNNLIRSIGWSHAVPCLITMTDEAIVAGIYDKAINLPKSEQGFWLVTNPTYRRNSYRLDLSQTITETIKNNVSVRYLSFVSSDPMEMIPSFGIHQIFLEVAFKHAVRLNPVIGKSTALDIRQGGCERFRDIALPFPGHPLPTEADGFAAPTALDFLFHDRYHAIRASRITPEETNKYIALGDKLNIMQQRYDAVIKILQKRHNEHKRVLPEFGMMIKDLPTDKRNEAIQIVFKKFNQEIAIINKLKKMRQSNGQLKFRLWDMERYFSGSMLFDSPLLQTPAIELHRFINNVRMDIHVLGASPGKIPLSKYSIHRTVQAIAEIIKPEETTTFENIKNDYRSAIKSGLLFLFEEKSIKIFNKALSELDVGTHAPN